MKEPPNPNSEPAPEWDKARLTWRWGWELHWISFAALFVALAAFSLVKLIRSTRLDRPRVARNLSVAVHLLILTLGLTRTLFLCLYPYELKRNAPGVPLTLARLLFGLGFPCLTSAFALIQIAFSESLKSSRVAYSKLGNVKFLLAVIGVHFGIVVVVDVITNFLEDTSFLYLLCIVYFLLMTLLTGLRIVYSGTKVILTSKRHREAIKELNLKQSHVRVEEEAAAPKANTKVLVITVSTALCCFLLLSLELYALVDSVRHLMSAGGHQPEPWPWYFFQSFFRLAELALACVVLYTVSAPSSN